MFLLANPMGLAISNRTVMIISVLAILLLPHTKTKDNNEKNYTTKTGFHVLNLCTNHKFFWIFDNTITSNINIILPKFKNIMFL